MAMTEQRTLWEEAEVPPAVLRAARRRAKPAPKAFACFYCEGELASVEEAATHTGDYEPAAFFPAVSILSVCRGCASRYLTLREQESPWIRRIWGLA